jgi:hypothetical protein
LAHPLKAARRSLGYTPEAKGALQNLVRQDVAKEFISEDDLETFEGWLRYQGFDAAILAPDELTEWRDMFDKARKDSLATPKVGLMKLRTMPGEHRYAVAVREGSDLWLTLWVRRSKKREIFVMVPRKDSDWDVHTSYHLDGTMHMKSFGRKSISKKLQPLTDAFKGTEHLGAQAGYAPRHIGAICNPADFSEVLEVAPGVLGRSQGSVVVDLVEPNCEPLDWHNVVRKEVFRDTVPWIVIRVCS